MIRRDHPHNRSEAAPYKSQGFSALAGLLPASERIEVLDLGPALRVNADFWSRYPCRLHIRDLYRDYAAQRSLEAEEKSEEIWDDLLSFNPGIHFDAVLAWDLLNYLEPQEIRAMVGRLSRWCRTGTLLFALVAPQPQIPALPALFRIIDARQISSEPSTEEMRSCPRHQPRDLARLFAGFDISHSFLLRNGIQEFIFTCR